MTQEEILEEYLKCKESPYYFASKYIKVAPYSGDKYDVTLLTEEEYNAIFKDYEAGKNY
jgi:hypothetical protein